jgi:uncharacterized protein (TIGR02453 family)
MSGFEGFSPAVFAWFEGIERDNSREYFTRTRDLFEREVRGGLEAMFDALSEEFEGESKVFRQHRDLRFTPDKRPYKDRTYGVLGRYYAAISSRGLYAGTGYYRVARDQLDRYRAAVADDGAGPRLEAALAGAGLEVAGMTLKSAPRGYPKDHPRIGLLRYKQLIVGAQLPAGDISRDAALAHVGGAWRAAAPVLAWLDEHVGPSTLPPPPSRYGSG